MYEGMGEHFGPNLNTVRFWMDGSFGRVVKARWPFVEWKPRIKIGIHCVLN